VREQGKTDWTQTIVWAKIADSAAAKYVTPDARQVKKEHKKGA